MPALLPTHLKSYESAISDEELFDLLSKHSGDFIPFFECAADDETWCEEHSQFMQNLLLMFTDFSFENKLEAQEFKIIVQKIQQHYRILNAFLPLNITFDIEGQEIPENSLLFSAASPFFHEYLWKDGFLKNTFKFSLNGLSFETFKIIEKFVTTGNVPDLWKKQETELKGILFDVNGFGLTELGRMTEEILKRYINRGNVLTMLIEAHLDGRLLLRHACYEYINALHLGFKFHETKLIYLAFEFLEFNENSLSVFREINNYITHLIMRGKLSEDLNFTDVVRECPSIIELNLSLSSNFSEKMFEAYHVSELDVSSCNWLNPNVLSQITEKFNNLKSLNLSDNIQLEYNAWGTLSKLQNLLSLDISRNSQINDDDFKLILQSCPQISDLNCSDCKKIGDKGFFELSRSLTHLMFLNLERCHISDGILIEIGVRSRFLEEINLNACHLLTDRGILELTRQSRVLKRLHIRDLNLKSETLVEIKRERPYLILL